MESPLAIVTLWTIRPEDSGVVFCQNKPESMDIWACLGVNPLDMPRTPYWASEGKHSQQPSMPYHPIFTSSYVNHLSHQWTALFLSYCNVT